MDLIDPILRATKDYWFLITLVASVILTVVYMIIFRVNPWDQQRSAKLRRDRVRFHDSVGYSLIETGHYIDARTEFEEALKLSAEDQTALNGRYIANLFINIGSQSADPAIGFAIHRRLADSASITREHHLHIIDKYLGDLYMRILDTPKAIEYYRSALGRKPEYPDALFALGWHYYSEGDSGLEEMERLFRELTRVDPRGYRGYHGLGYALYMKALAENDANARSKLIQEAAEQSGAAQNLFYNQLNVVMDLGEVSRSVYPDVAFEFHEYGKEIINDPELYAIGDNPYPLRNKFLRKAGEVHIASKDQKLAWITYQMSLDKLASARRSGDDSYMAEHHRLFEEARELDKDDSMRPIYKDQRSVLNLLLPDSRYPGSD